MPEQARAERLREKARDHELRIALLDALGEEEASGPELRAKLAADKPLSVIGYHLAVLIGAGLVERIGGLYRLAR